MTASKASWTVFRTRSIVSLKRSILAPKLDTSFRPPPFVECQFLLLDHILKQVALQFRLAGIAGRGQMIHLDRAFQPLAKILPHPLK